MEPLREMHVRLVVYSRRNENYILAIDFDSEESWRQARHAIGRWASNPDLAFTWYDAAKLLDRMEAQR